MPQTGAAGFRRSDRYGESLPVPIVGFDPVGEITALDNRVTARRLGSDRLGSDEVGSDEVGSDEVGSDELGSDRRGSDRLGDEQGRWMAVENRAESRAAAR